ncbi:MAG: HAMP domain-containing sensor histidine kinase, partial [Bacteroidota bacterium]
KEYSFTAADCSVLVRSAMEAMSFQLAQGGFRVRVSTPRATLTIKADPDAVKQAIINIVSNAIKYSGERRVVTVRLVRKDRAARCSIADRGLGIPAESLPHIFERFYRDQSVQKKAQGVGLGLPLVKHIMDAHNGRIEVDSTPGKGSTFTLTFPLWGDGPPDDDMRREEHA